MTRQNPPPPPPFLLQALQDMGLIIHKRGGTHPQVHPLVQHPLAVELTQQAGGRDAEGGVGRGSPSARHVVEEVVPQLAEQRRAAQQGQRSTGLE